MGNLFASNVTLNEHYRAFYIEDNYFI